MAFGVDQTGPLIVIQSLLQGAAHVGWSLDVEALYPVGGGKFDEVGVTFKVHPAFAVFKEKLLPLTDHAEVVVVEDQYFKG